VGNQSVLDVEKLLDCHVYGGHVDGTEEAS
jgi:hypothetical protein